MGLFHATGAKRLRKIKMKIVLLTASAAILGSSLIGCAQSGAPTPQQMHQLQPADKVVVLQEEKEIQKSDAVKKDTFAAAENILQGKQLLQQAQNSLKDSTFFLAAEHDLSQAYGHFVEAEKHGVDVSHYIKQIKDIYQQIVQADFEQLREDVEHRIESRYWQDALYIINEFEKQLLRTEKFVDKKYYDAEVKIFRGKVHTAYIEHQFTFARDLLQKASNEGALPQVSMEVKDALSFMERNKSHDLGLNVKKLREEGNEIIGSAFLKQAPF